LSSSTSFMLEKFDMQLTYKEKLNASSHTENKVRKTKEVQLLTYQGPRGEDSFQSNFRFL
jgi:hypothetical protein